MLPPDAPSGAGTPPSQPVATEAVASSTPASTSTPERPFTTPADDYKSQYEELKGKYARYEKYGDPDQLDQAIDWARARAAEIQAGKLKLVEDKPPPAPTADVMPDNWEELGATQQRDWLREDAKRTVRAEREALKAELEAPLKQQAEIIGMQQQIYMQASELAREYGIPFDKAMAESMRVANLDRSGLLKHAFENLAGPQRTEKEIERRVNEALAKQAQERENAEMQHMVSRGAPRFATEPAKDPNEQRQQTRMTIARKIREEVRNVANRGRGAA